jgi:hypothetical protein
MRALDVVPALWRAGRAPETLGNVTDVARTWATGAAGHRTRPRGDSGAVRFQSFAFGSVQIDGETYDHDVVLDRGVIRKRDKKASRPLRSAYGHTPLSLSEEIPWDCRRLVVGTGAQGALPLVPELRREAERRGVELVALPTVDAIALLEKDSKGTNAVLHVTC